MKGEQQQKIESASLALTEENLASSSLDERTRGGYEVLRNIIAAHPAIAKASIEDLVIKICVIDTTNSTHLSASKNEMSVHELAEIIKDIPFIDGRIEEGDPAVVEEITRAAKVKYKRNPFSFATKFCAYHNRFVYGRDDYSIYDSKVKTYLPAYCTDGTTENKLQTMRDSMQYKKFNDCVWNVLCANGLDGIKDARMKLDRFLWTKTDKAERVQDEEN